MKKTLFLGLALVAVLSLILLSNKDDKQAGDLRVIKIGATPIPHAELLDLVKDDLLEEGIQLEIVEFTDYVTPNIALSTGEIDANFFQHVPYLEKFAAERGLDLSSLGTVHVEPLGLYSQSINHVDDLKEGDQIAIPSDAVNGGRALILLEHKGLIKLKPGAGLEATPEDIIENPLKLAFKPIEAAQLARVLQDVDGAIINGNYALEAGLSPATDALLLEDSESPYANILTVRTKDLEDSDLAKVLEALHSEEVRDHIANNYGGGVVEAFGKNK